MRDSADFRGEAPADGVVPPPGDVAAGDDPRHVYRITLDVLADPDQLEPLMGLLGTAVCGQPDDHDGPCRLAWQMTASGPDREQPVPPDEQRRIRRALTALEVWPSDEATTDLLAEWGETPRGRQVFGGCGRMM